jgi:sensor histidine kinase regulating citrate/malate metabolism
MAIDKVATTFIILILMACWGGLIWGWASIYKNEKNTSVDKGVKSLFATIGTLFLIAITIAFGKGIHEQIQENAMALAMGVNQVVNTGNAVVNQVEATGNKAVNKIANAAKQITGSS